MTKLSLVADDYAREENHEECSMYRDYDHVYYNEYRTVIDEIQRID